MCHVILSIVLFSHFGCYCNKRLLNACLQSDVTLVDHTLKVNVLLSSFNFLIFAVLVL